MDWWDCMILAFCLSIYSELREDKFYDLLAGFWMTVAVFKLLGGVFL